ncbi:conserved hypothetical protein [Halobacteriovorax marinus SJ]|uniref:Metallo-beta-lactamase domain-containing protein n=1 Tax=Halobacteriovorax marinus (strain ATCC BAA-682 / DSM 15412 / SJ) TaxID=862908 RepID=E1X031_HALMS|nr:MBL fold metallo-hydrolase [Halobacteriovorax marinus]CBW27967.1 conserved hypothetical protein [Halobacteriovorax marinus SJ]
MNRVKNISILTSLIIFVFIIYLLSYAFLSLGSNPNQEDRERFASSDHFDTSTENFINRDQEALEKMNERMAKRKNEAGAWISFFFGNENQRKPLDRLPVLKPNLGEFLKPSDKLKVIWFGHSSFLINISGKTILVDPIVSEFASPFFFIVRRFQSSPLSLEELPRIDYVLISHDHYDHLDMPTIKFFRDKDTKFMVPLGVGAHLEGWGIEKSSINEFDWWDKLEFDDIEFVATPAQHFSGRSFSNKNSTLWAGWIIKNVKKRIFFSGDSGYDIHFKEIGEKYGPFDIAFFDNGQYNKNWEEVHLLPEQGVEAFYDLKAKIFFPVHWGAFTLSTHSWFEPAQKIYDYSVERNFPIIMPNIGEIVEVSEDYRTKRWWMKFQ